MFLGIDRLYFYAGAGALAVLAGVHILAPAWIHSFCAHHTAAMLCG